MPAIDFTRIMDCNDIRMSQLPRREATVFCLRYFDDLSYEQIAESLSIKTGAVATALHKARELVTALYFALPGNRYAPGAILSVDGGSLAR